jgi:hypothetical protein
VKKVSSIEQDTGSIVFFMEEIEVSGWLSEAYLDITVDNAFYIYVASEADEPGPVWSGPPLYIDGFVESARAKLEGGNPGDLWELSEEGYLVPKEGVIDIDAKVVRSIEHIDLKDHLKQGTNYLSIVAFNAHPEPKSKQVSSNTAGLIYKLGGTATEPLVISPGIRIPLDDDLPDIGYTLTPMKLTPVQAVFDCDLAGSTGEDGVLDMVLGKPMAVLVSIQDETDPPDSIYVTLGESTPIELVDSEVNAYDIFSVIFEPSETGPMTISGYGLRDGETAQIPFDPVEIQVIATSEPSIAFSYLHRGGASATTAQLPQQIMIPWWEK